MAQKIIEMLLLCFSLILVLSSTVSAAEIYGDVYDLSFNRVDNAIVRVDTQPQQQIVAQDGKYNMNVSSGTYTIYAEKDGISASEMINVSEEGSYRIDMILFPDFENDDLLEEDIVIDEFEPVENESDILLYVVSIIISMVLGLLFVFRKSISKNISVVISRFQKPKSSHPDFLDGDDLRSQVIKFIRTQDGRTTQREIRKNFPLSEAKVSLIISELEHEGVLKKFKAGRGNVIVLKSD